MNDKYGVRGDVVCYQVTNYEAAYANDVDVITKLEQQLAGAGAIPAKIDFELKLCCMEIVLDRLELDLIAQIFKSLNLHAYPLGKA